MFIIIVKSELISGIGQSSINDVSFRVSAKSFCERMFILRRLYVIRYVYIASDLYAALPGFFSLNATSGMKQGAAEAT